MSRCAVQHLYPELGVDLGERAYGADCRLYIPGQGVNWPVIKATVFDEFVVAHTLGWWGKVSLHLSTFPSFAESDCAASSQLWLPACALHVEHALPPSHFCWSSSCGSGTALLHCRR